MLWKKGDLYLMQQRRDRNRKRSKRRAIYCPIHGCHLDSTSQKHPLFADRADHLRERGMTRKNALTLMAHRSTVALRSEWLEAFWCQECQATKWYHVRRADDRHYEVRLAPPEFWQQTSGTISPDGNPSVGEFTRKQARQATIKRLADFQAIR